jgi:hypothetical protein
MVVCVYRRLTVYSSSPAEKYVPWGLIGRDSGSSCHAKLVLLCCATDSSDWRERSSENRRRCSPKTPKSCSSPSTGRWNYASRALPRNGRRLTSASSRRSAAIARRPGCNPSQPERQRASASPGVSVARLPVHDISASWAGVPLSSILFPLRRRLPAHARPVPRQRSHVEAPR